MTQINHDEATGVVHVSGRFDAYALADFRTVAEPLLDRGGTDLPIDLSAVTFVDSAALAELVRCLKLVRFRDGELVIVGASPAVRLVLELSRLDRAIPLRL